MSEATLGLTFSVERRGDEYIGRCAEYPHLGFFAPFHDTALAGIKAAVLKMDAALKENSEPKPDW